MESLHRVIPLRTMKIEIKLNTHQSAHIIKNMWPAYQHELAQYNGAIPNKYGLFGVGNEIKSLDQHAELQNPWWEDPSSLFPYIIWVDEKAAGFCLVAGRKRLPDEINADFVIHEFFLLHPYRGHGIAKLAALEAIKKHPGKWEIVTDPDNHRALKFWTGVIKELGNAIATPVTCDHVWGRKVKFEFATEG